MRIIITGATGFIGKALVKELSEAGYEIVALSRNPEKSEKLFGERVKLATWDGKTSSGWGEYADGACAIINLAGENIGSGRWDKAKKEKIVQSRLNAGKAIVEAIKLTKKKPEVLIQASATGYYGSRLDEIIDEQSSAGKGFLPEVALRWEDSTREVESYGVRRIIIRTGVVLGKGEGAFPRLLKPFKFFLGGPLGNGEQWFSWIHLQDEVKAIRFLVERKELSGVFNLTSPGSLKQKELCKVLGKVLNRPSWFKVPGFILKLFFGEMAEEVLLSGQRVMPKRLLESGFVFLFPEAETALQDILKKK